MTWSCSLWVNLDIIFIKQKALAFEKQQIHNSQLKNQSEHMVM